VQDKGIVTQVLKKADKQSENEMSFGLLQLIKEMHVNYLCNTHDTCQATLFKYTRTACIVQWSGESSTVFWRESLPVQHQFGELQDVVRGSWTTRRKEFPVFTRRSSPYVCTLLVINRSN